MHTACLARCGKPHSRGRARSPQPMHAACLAEGQCLPESRRHRRLSARASGDPCRAARPRACRAEGPDQTWRASRRPRCLGKGSEGGRAAGEPRAVPVLHARASRAREQRVRVRADSLLGARRRWWTSRGPVEAFISLSNPGAWDFEQEPRLVRELLEGSLEQRVG